MIVEGLLLDVDYITKDNKAILRLFLRDSEKAFVVYDENFEPYFYVFPKDSLDNTKKDIENLNDKRIIKIEKCKKKFIGKDVEVLRVVVDHPQSVPKVREVIKNLQSVEKIAEYDIPYARRYVIDKGLVPMQWLKIECKKSNNSLFAENIEILEKELPELKILAFDIEVYNPKGAPRFDRDPIIMINLVSNTGLKKVLTWKEIDLDFVETCISEKAMIKRFEEIINEEDFDIIIGYNSSAFDFPYLKKRLEKLGMNIYLGRDRTPFKVEARTDVPEVKINGRVHIDLYPIVRRNMSLSSYVLENVVKEILGIEKEKIEGKDIWKVWDEDDKEGLARLANYALEDAYYTFELGKKFLPLYYELSKLVKQPLQDVSRMTAGQLVEWFLLREAYYRNEIAPNKPKKEELKAREEETYVGGYVMEPKKGIKENIAVFDFRSLYPSIIVTHNIDPSTLITDKNCKENKVPELGYCFSKEKEGFIPSILKMLIEKRQEVKKRMKEAEGIEKKFLDVQQKALKILANSFYGYMGYARARWYRRECAESVAAFARYYIKKVMEVAEKEFNLEVVYGDTDSLFVLIPENKKEIIKEFLEYINKSLPGNIELEFEGFYKRGIFVTKKKYALISEDGKIIAKGLEVVRRDWAKIAKETQQKVIEVLLKEGSPEKALQIVRDVIKRIKNRKVSLDDITIYTQITKNISEYKTLEPHVVAAKKLQKKGVKIAPGMIIGYVITKGAKSISQRAEPVDYVSLEDYDPEYYIENQILPAVERIFEVIGYSKSFLRASEKQQTLTRWFS